MAAKFNPGAIYGDSSTTFSAPQVNKQEKQKLQIRRFDGRTDTTDVSHALLLHSIPYYDLIYNYLLLCSSVQLGRIFST